ncbi:ATP-binding cassette sub-family C member 4-like [Dysidea avara]|uniref:ATP-binding cassette sub-family C member 4-like n=1 Tax=Dysidea avara TaxID=196820 RepID=UPI00332F8E50
MNSENDMITSKQEEIEDTTRDAYLYAVGLILAMICAIVTHAWGYHTALNYGMQVRIIATDAIYHKILKLSHSTIGQLSIGHIVNLTSNDVHRFEVAFYHIHEFWIIPVFLPIVIYLLWREVGPSSLVAMVLLLLQALLQYALTQLYARWRLESAKVTDKRVRVMNEIISGMRLIKMYAWEWAFHEYVKKIRKKESKLITKASMVRACNIAVYFVSINILNFTTFSTYAGAGNILTAKKVFTFISLMTFSSQYFVNYFLDFLLSLSEMKVAIQRIQKLLLLPELGDTISGHTDSGPVKTTSRAGSLNVMPPLKLVNEEVTVHGLLSIGVPPRIIVNNLTASWTHDKKKVVLKDIKFSVDQSIRLLAVVGPVGSGKVCCLLIVLRSQISAFLFIYTVLRELEALDGSVDIEGSISYASQDPWIFSGTMPFGDETLIGERGVNLSGGQKARVNLARAVYRDSDIMLLDDPLSAVDAAVSRHLFDRCICGALADTLVILVTHQLKYTEHADRILVLKEGCVQGYGNYEELTSSGVDPTKLYFDDVEDKRKSADLVLPDIVVEECDDVTEETDEEPERKSNHAQLLPVEKTRRCVRSKYLQYDHQFNPVIDVVSLCSIPSIFSLMSIPDDVRRVLNRFSKDIGFMDDLLPVRFLQVLTLFLRFFAITIAACVANCWLFIPATIIVVMLFVFRWFFLHTSRHIKRLETLARSPLYSHISSTIQGLSTIRAYKEEEKFSKDLHCYLDEHTKGWYLYIATNRWFGMRIDLISAIFLAIVTFSAIPLADNFLLGDWLIDSLTDSLPAADHD